MTALGRRFGQHLSRVPVRALARNQARELAWADRPPTRRVALAEWLDADRRSRIVFITRGIALQEVAAVWQARAAA